MSVLEIMNYIAAVIGYLILAIVASLIVTYWKMKWEGRREAKKWLKEINWDDRKQSSSGSDTEN